MRPQGLGDIKRALLVLTEGGLGDLLFGAPLAEVLCKNYPGCTVTCWVSPAHKPILYGNPYVHDYLDMPDGLKLRERSEVIRKGRFDLAVILWTCSRQTWPVYFSGIPRRVGRADKLLYSWTFTHPVKMRCYSGDTFSHWVDCQFDHARVLGCDVSGARPRIWISDEETASARRLLAQHGARILDRLCLMQIGRGISGMDLAKWPIEKFVAIGNKLVRELGVKLLLTGLPSEAEVVAEVEARVPGSVSIAGKTDLRMLCAVIAEADVVVSPDSGPGHIAAALGVPVVSIFAPKKSFPYRWRPYGDIHEVVIADKSLCRRKYKHCFPDRCERFVCLLGINEFDVADAAYGILRACPKEQPRAR